MVIAGGGPAGMMLGLLLARRGLTVTVLEKHADFLRDFRGDTIHPSTITLLGEIGLREAFLDLPLSRIETLDMVIDGERLTLVDFGTLPPPDNFLVLAPQWDLLNFLAAEGAKLPGFEVRMSTEATGLLFEGDAVTGVIATGGTGETGIRAQLTVAADGRGSNTRDFAGLAPQEYGVPIDVLWFSMPKPQNAPPPTLAYLDGHGLVLTIDRHTYYQGGMVIRKGGFDELKAHGLAAFRQQLVRTSPVLATVVDSIAGWQQVKLLSVQVNRLLRWYRTGLLAIGDAAHAMSPVGGVGINYAIQDAVATANLLSEPLLQKSLTPEHLAAVQRRRLPPAKRMQRIQLAVHSRISRPSAGRGTAFPRPVRELLKLGAPLVRRVAARVIGYGFRPEHVEES
ncbi:FAD-dependent oxidoreductase [soil metagenome]